MKRQKAEKLIHYDKESDVFYIGVQQGVEEEFVEVAPGVSVELNGNGQVIGVEILNASKVFQPVAEQASSRQKG